MLVGWARVDWSRRNLDEVMRVLPYRPKLRYIELAPKYWQATRSNLDPVELEADLCSFTIPPTALNFAR